MAEGIVFSSSDARRIAASTIIVENTPLGGGQRLRKRRNGSFGGGVGTTLSIGIVTVVNESAGTVAVKDILLGDDYSASPNYQTADEIRTVPFLKD